MQQEYAINRCTRRCKIGQRELKPGESFYSVVVSDRGGLVRADFAAENWQGPPEGAVGWWRHKMPDGIGHRLRPAPVDVLLDTLSQLLEHPDKASLSYLLALLLVRRRVLVDDESLENLQASEADPAQRTTWPLVLAADGRQWNVPIAMPRQDDLPAVQQELANLLFTEE